VTRTWLGILAFGVLVAACAEPNPPPSAPPATPTADTGAQRTAPAQPPGPMTDNMPPSALDANPPGTPSYVIAPGDPVGRRSSQYPRPGGGPAF
jgi:hypothetical protein